MTLTQAAQSTQKFILFSTIISILSISGFVGYNLWKIYNPPPQVEIQELPTLDYGNLPLPNFPDSKASSANFSYSIDTVDGNLPTFEKLVKVFIMPPIYASLLSGEKSQKLAEKLNLIPIPQILSEIEYRYSNTEAFLLINLDTGNFTFEKQTTPSAQLVEIQSQSALVSDFKSLLTNLGQLNDETNNGNSKVIFLKNSRNNFEQTPNIGEATALQISLWPADIDGKRIYTPSNNSALINAIITGDPKDINNYLSIKYTFWPVDTSAFATYPSKTAYEALEDLKSGQGVILQEPATPKVSILNVHLGYYQSDKYARYLQPIYVVEGSGFLAYVPAISNQYYEVPQ